MDKSTESNEVLFSIKNEILLNSLSVVYPFLNFYVYIFILS